MADRPTSTARLAASASAGSALGLRKNDPATSALLGLAVLLGVVLPVSVSAASGNLAIPHNDSWAYSRIAVTFARTGHIHLLGWGKQALFGQFVVLGPLARWITAQHLFVAVLGAVVVIATYDLLRPSTGTRRAAFGALVIASWPGFALLSTSFMSDVPALAGSLVCLAVGRRALTQGRTALLTASLAVGLWACTVREQALAAPAAVFLVAAWQAYRRRAGLVRLACLGMGFAAMLVAFETWRRSFPGQDPGLKAHASPSMLTTRSALHGYLLVALACAPAVALVIRPLRWRPGAWLGAGAGATLSVHSVHKYHALHMFPGNYLDPHGPYVAIAHGVPPLVIPIRAWHVLAAIACVSATLLAGVIVRRLRHLEPVLLLFLVFTACGTLATAYLGQLGFDRYWLPLMPPVLALLLGDRAPPPSPVSSDGPRRTVATVLPGTAAAALAVILATTALVIMSAGLAYDRARWSAAVELARRGIPATDIDAGMDWVGSHAPGGMSPPHSHRFPGTRECFVVSVVAPKPHAAPVVAVRTYRDVLIIGPRRTLYTYWTAYPGCPVPPRR